MLDFRVPTAMMLEVRQALPRDSASIAACDAQEMGMTSAFTELIEAAQRIGISVRHAKLGGTGGGMARVKGARQLFIDLDAMPEDQLEQTLHALAGLPEIDAVFVRPDVRKLLDEAKRDL